MSGSIIEDNDYNDVPPKSDERTIYRRSISMCLQITDFHNHKSNNIPDYTIRPWPNHPHELRLKEK